MDSIAPDGDSPASTCCHVVAIPEPEPENASSEGRDSESASEAGIKNSVINEQRRWLFAEAARLARVDGSIAVTALIPDRHPPVARLMAECAFQAIARRPSQAGRGNTESGDEDEDEEEDDGPQLLVALDTGVIRGTPFRPVLSLAQVAAEGGASGSESEGEVKGDGESESGVRQRRQRRSGKGKGESGSEGVESPASAPIRSKEQAATDAEAIKPKLDKY